MTTTTATDPQTARAARILAGHTIHIRVPVAEPGLTGYRCVCGDVLAEQAELAGFNEQLAGHHIDKLRADGMTVSSETARHVTEQHRMRTRRGRGRRGIPVFECAECGTTVSGLGHNPTVHMLSLHLAEALVQAGASYPTLGAAA